MPTLSDLVVFDQLTVDDLRIEPKRVSAGYSLRRMDGSVASTRLYYTYGSPFFRPGDAADRNLASVMLAQLAVNYGLFCRRIVFDGLFDSVDRRFILDAMENTSREIYVNKFLLPNEFLLPPFDSMEPEQRDRYTAAEVVFINTMSDHLQIPPPENPPDERKFAILSSGGKDSLLTYGIVKEFWDAHPVFVNESGRHWYTAYNSYHHFRKIEPNTVKPWCNGDRIFNWMVRQMPFIRPNFQQIRADIYPIRLWTVALFLFGALPVVRKRQIGHILVGDEYDTTFKLNHHGITHYAALYDQSKYFDNAMTRYYHRKGWNCFQYSLLRSLSEMLILKTLVKRYPDLQRHQVSCHACHKSGDRMLPCGNCEKCRRIVGMLVALDEDPGRCGYDEKQIKRCLRSLETKKIKQISSDARHLYLMLLLKSAIADTDATRKMAGEHPEIMSLRFDRERSNLKDMPGFVRKELFTVLRQYARGAVRLEDRRWKAIDLDAYIRDTPYFLQETKYGTT